MVRSFFGGGGGVLLCHGNCLIGTIGGILIMLDERVVEKIDCSARNLSVSFLFWNVDDSFELGCSGVFGPNDDVRA